MNDIRKYIQLVENAEKAQEKFMRALEVWQSTMPEWMENDDLAAIKHLKHGMRPFNRNVLLYRGDGYCSDDFARGVVSDFRTDDRILFNDFLALTFDPVVAKRFMKTEIKSHCDVFVLLTVTLKPDTPCVVVGDHLPENDDEKEVILPPGAEFKIVNREKQTSPVTWTIDEDADEDEGVVITGEPNPNAEWWKAELQQI